MVKDNVNDWPTYDHLFLILAVQCSQGFFLLLGGVVGGGGGSSWLIFRIDLDLLTIVDVYVI